MSAVPPIVSIPSGLTATDRVRENSFDQSLAQSLDNVRSKIAWLSRDRGDVAGWLKENGYGA